MSLTTLPIELQENIASYFCCRYVRVLDAYNILHISESYFCFHKEDSKLKTLITKNHALCIRDFYLNDANMRAYRQDNFRISRDELRDILVKAANIDECLFNKISSRVFYRLQPLDLISIIYDSGNFYLFDTIDMNKKKWTMLLITKARDKKIQALLDVLKLGYGRDFSRRCCGYKNSQFYDAYVRRDKNFVVNALTSGTFLVEKKYKRCFYESLDEDIIDMLKKTELAKESYLFEKLTDDEILSLVSDGVIEIVDALDKSIKFGRTKPMNFFIDTFEKNYFVIYKKLVITAVKYSDVATIERLSKMYVPPNITFTLLEEPLDKAIDIKCVEKIKCLVDTGAFIYVDHLTQTWDANKEIAEYFDSIRREISRAFMENNIKKDTCVTRANKNVDGSWYFKIEQSEYVNGLGCIRCAID